jgi:hypothetical protein
MDNEWQEVLRLWEVRKAADPQLAAEIVAAIDKIFFDDNKQLRTPDWLMINDAEKQLARVFTEAQLKSQYSQLLRLAARRALASLTTYPDRAAFVALSEEDKRETYADLLYELQTGFIEGRFIRQLRKEVAETLWRYGIKVAGIAMLIPLIWLFITWLGLPKELPNAAPVPIYIDETIFVLAAVGSTGALGAFFSRAMRFQSDLPSLSFDMVTQNYVERMLRLRLLYGVIGAVVFYFFIRGAFVGGNLFPKLLPGMISEQTTWMLHAFVKGKTAITTLNVPAATDLSPTGEFAKLLVWSFLAGFSERLVPDTLSQLEKKSSDALQNAKP